MARSVAAATTGSVIFGGVALACDHHHDHSHDSARGGDGVGGEATNNCLNVGVPVLSGIGIGGSGEAEGATCTARADGSGGNAY
ncbi:MAG TPA: hypothetical protein VFA63_13940 [Pseudonocardiaceae bacterium]|nr:hypothetical protein [Pseudonocardiaceae bacterium]